MTLMIFKLVVEPCETASDEISFSCKTLLSSFLGQWLKLVFYHELMVNGAVEAIVSFV